MGSGGSFSLSSFYRYLAGNGNADDTQFPWRIIWVAGVPTKISFFLWAAALGRVLMIDYLI